MTSQGDLPSPSGVLASGDAGTPLALPDAGSADTLEALEFEGVLAAVASHAAGPLGAARVQSRRPATDPSWIRAELARVTEAATLARQGRGVVAEAVPDLDPVLHRLGTPGTVLEGAELLSVWRLLVASRLVATELDRVAAEAPLVAELAVPLPQRGLERRLETALDAMGELLDTASPALAGARREVRAARERLVRRLEVLLRELGSGPEVSVTIRDGRYVIPVPREARNRPAGIVHDESASGGTLFIEPAPAVEQGNALRAAEAAVEREVLRVLRDLTEQLRPHREALVGAFAMCVAVDDLVARAGYAGAVDGSAPTLVESPGPLRIVNGRHPLLLARGTHAGVVPFDLMLDSTERTVLLTGPNTGGKTVLLKAIGLLAVLTQSGIIPPLGPGSTMPVFRRWFVDIGDRQSIAASLSTFSAHAGQLRRVLEEAEASSLVLLDEIGSGTDPAEGGALAGAALRFLTRRGALTVATTHLGVLKELAASSTGIVNASLQFDAATLRPTYRLEKGLPGRSYGLAIARQLGIAPDVLAEAEATVPAAERALDALLAKVEAQGRELETTAADLARRQLELESLGARLAVQEQAQARRELELKSREREAERAAREQARAYLLEARHRVEQAIGQARAAVDEVTAREARRLVEEGIRAEAEALASGQLESEDERGAAAGEMKEGSRVRLGGGTQGVVAEQRSDGKLVVVVGAMKLVVDPSQVVGTAGNEVAKRPSPTSVAPSAAPNSSASLELDLRGLTGDEAEAAVLAAVDAAVLADRPFLRIIHGKGTGVLRDRVHRLAAADRRVARFAFAPAPEGGTGVTVLEFER